MALVSEPLDVAQCTKIGKHSAMSTNEYLSTIASVHYLWALVRSKKMIHFCTFLRSYCTLCWWSLMKRGHETRDDHGCMITHRSSRAYNLTPQIVGPSIKDYFAIYFGFFVGYFLYRQPCRVKLGSK